MAGLGTETDRIEKHTCTYYNHKHKKIRGQYSTDVKLYYVTVYPFLTVQLGNNSHTSTYVLVQWTTTYLLL